MTLKELDLEVVTEAHYKTIQCLERQKRRKERELNDIVGRLEEVK